MNIYIVKSFGAQSGYLNLKAFTNQEQAEAYAKQVEQQIPVEAIESGDEFVEVEEMSCEQ